MAALGGEFSWILVGGKKEAKELYELKRKGVKYILNVTPPRSEGGVSNFYQNETSHLGDLLFEYLRLPMQDNASERLDSWYEEAWAFFELAKTREDGGVLVHCNQGVSRSAAIVASYLMKFHGLSKEDALRILKKARPQVSPNECFLSQLQQLEEKLLDERKNAVGRPSPSSSQGYYRPLSRETNTSSARALASDGGRPSKKVRGPMYGPQKGPTPSSGSAEDKVAADVPPNSGSSAVVRRAPIGPSLPVGLIPSSGNVLNEASESAGATAASGGEVSGAEVAAAASGGKAEEGTWSSASSSAGCLTPNFGVSSSESATESRSGDASSGGPPVECSKAADEC